MRSFFIILPPFREDYFSPQMGVVISSLLDFLTRKEDTDENYLKG
jgi:hypothetical protein